MIIKYSIFTLLLIAGIVLFFVGLLNGGPEEGHAVFNMLMISGFMLTGFMVIMICFNLSEDF